MKVLNTIKEILSEYVLPLFIVPKCVSCFSLIPSDKDALCDKCKRIYEIESKLSCSICHRPHPYCSCRVEFEEISRPLFHVTGYDIKREAISKNIVLHIKENYYPTAFDSIADQMAEVLNRRFPMISSSMLSDLVITWVPRSKRAKRKAGHDQSLELAKRLSKTFECELLELFENNSDTYQKTLGKEQRHENAKKNYALIEDAVAAIGERYVVLIDDIVTTGASVGACAKLLSDANVKNVLALVYAKTDSHRSVDEEAFAI